MRLWSTWYSFYGAATAEVTLFRAHLSQKLTQQAWSLTATLMAGLFRANEVKIPVFLCCRYFRFFNVYIGFLVIIANH